MHRQVGDLGLDDDGVARRGLLVRHLVLPDGLAGTKEIMQFLAREISPQTYVNVMGQYRPCGRASEHPSLRQISHRPGARRGPAPGPGGRPDPPGPAGEIVQVAGIVGEGKGLVPSLPPHPPPNPCKGAM